MFLTNSSQRIGLFTTIHIEQQGLMLPESTTTGEQPTAPPTPWNYRAALDANLGCVSRSSR